MTALSISHAPGVSPLLLWLVNILSSEAAWKFDLLLSGGDNSMGYKTSGLIPERGFSSPRRQYFPVLVQSWQVGFHCSLRI